MYFSILGSGSKGNATLVFHKNTIILIDMGISLCRLEEGLKKYGKNLNDIDFALFTHDHTDHISGLKFLSPKKCYALEGTLPDLANILQPGKEYKMKDFFVTAYSTSHDATNPCGYFIKSENESLAYFTDTGKFPVKVIDFIKNPTYLIIESNHDISLEMKTNRPFELKERILGEYGHLCNEDSAFAASEIIGESTKAIYLAHLSEEANSEEIALKAYKEIFAHTKTKFDLNNVHCAKQYEPVFGGTKNED